MLIDSLKDIVGPQGWKEEPADLEPFLQEWRGRTTGDALIVISPRTAQEVSAVVRTCAEAGVSVVPQGGNTGLCGGALPSSGQVLLSMNRMTAAPHRTGPCSRPAARRSHRLRRRSGPRR